MLGIIGHVLHICVVGRHGAAHPLKNLLLIIWRHLHPHSAQDADFAAQIILAHVKNFLPGHFSSGIGPAAFCIGSKKQLEVAITSRFNSVGHVGQLRSVHHTGRKRVHVSGFVCLKTGHEDGTHVIVILLGNLLGVLEHFCTPFLRCRPVLHYSSKGLRMVIILKVGIGLQRVNAAFCVGLAHDVIGVAHLVFVIHALHIFGGIDHSAEAPPDSTKSHCAFVQVVPEVAFLFDVDRCLLRLRGSGLGRPAHGGLCQSRRVAALLVKRHIRLPPTKRMK